MRIDQIHVNEWINDTPENMFSLKDGSIKFIHFFQMLCPGCIYFGIPETLEVYQKYQSPKFKVYGIHSVFEHHEVMTASALRVFLHEWKLPFPVGIDQHLNDHWMPETMRALQLQGTPTTVIVDQTGKVRLNHFGQFDKAKLHSFIEGMINQGDII